MGKIFKFHTDVDTDQIIASQYLLFPTIDEMKAHTFESLDPTFAERVKPGDYVVAAENFGCGSSREQAPSVLKALVSDGDEMELSLTDGTASVNGQTFTCTKLPPYMQNILDQGGLIASLNKEEA